MQNETVYPFRNFIDAIICYRFKNPARQKSVNLLEPESGSREHYDAFDPRCKDRVFAATIHAMQAAEKNVPRNKLEAFRACRIGTENRGPISPIDFARSVGKSHMTIYRWLYDVEQIFIRELVKRGLMPEPEESEKKYRDARKNYEKFAKEKAKQKKADLLRQRNGNAERVVYRSE